MWVIWQGRERSVRGQCTSISPRSKVCTLLSKSIGRLRPCQLYCQTCCLELRLWKELTIYLTTFLCLPWCGKISNSRSELKHIVASLWCHAHHCVFLFWVLMHFVELYIFKCKNLAFSCSNSFHNAKDKMPNFHCADCAQLNFKRQSKTCSVAIDF